MSNTIEFNKKDENPFNNFKNTLRLFQQSSNNINEDDLDKAYSECKTEEDRKMLFSLIFSIGDITNRQHNIFKNIKVDSGGNSERENFYKSMLWMKENHQEQFYKFLRAGLFNEFTSFDNLFRSRIATNKKGIVLDTFDIFSDRNYCTELVKYCAKIINGNNPYNKMLLSKFLTPPRVTKRSNHNKMLDETSKVMANKAAFLVMLSKQMNWEYIYIPNKVANFKGYRHWRKSYNQELESVLFSSKKILEFDQTEFTEWLNKLPAKARFRVKTRLNYSKDSNDNLKWGTLLKWYQNWEQLKIDAQDAKRIIEEKLRQGLGTIEDQEELVKLKKEAKVTIGATNFKELYDDICNNNVDKLKLESFIDKVNLPYNSLVIIDDSGSMRGAPYEFAMFLATVCMVKNPDDVARNMLVHFSDDCRVFTSADRKAKHKNNSLLKADIVKTTSKPLIDGNLSFYDNYKNLSDFSRSVFKGNGTYLNTIPKGFAKAVEKDSNVLDQLKNYPIWTIVSDTDINSSLTNKSSMIEFFNDCQKLLGYKPFLVCINIGNDYEYDITRFAGIDNCMVINNNPAQIEQFLTNFKDIDVYDIYTPLLSLYRSNRYEFVRKHVI